MQFWTSLYSGVYINLEKNATWPRFGITGILSKVLLLILTVWITKKQHSYFWATFVCISELQFARTTHFFSVTTDWAQSDASSHSIWGFGAFFTPRYLKGLYYRELIAHLKAIRVVSARLDRLIHSRRCILFSLILRVSILDFHPNEWSRTDIPGAFDLLSGYVGYLYVYTRKFQWRL